MHAIIHLSRSFLNASLKSVSCTVVAIKLTVNCCKLVIKIRPDTLVQSSKDIISGNPIYSDVRKGLNREGEMEYYEQK